ncbi:MAG: beta-galactosidase, partial [Succinivibrio sp.]|nr:beta-galactosidase [Succinivibrio sp.]
MFHGCDYNPEQWLENPEILEKDLELMKKAHCNIVSLGIFAWSTLEPEEGVFNFAWLDEILDKLNANGIKVFLATPSGARPNWMSQKYPEVLRVNDEYQRA